MELIILVYTIFSQNLGLLEIINLIFTSDRKILFMITL